MKFRCPEGHLVESTWERLRNKRTCPTCIANLKKKVVNMQAKKKGTDYRVLALDQSSHKTGYSIYDGKELISYGVFETTKLDPMDRLQDIASWLDSMIANWKPDMVGLEDTQYNPGGTSKDQIQAHDTFKLLSQVMGVVIIIALRAGCKVKTVLIPTWRHHCKVKGNHRVDQKRSAQMLVKSWHDITVTDDESDAICIGKYFADKHNDMPIIGDDSWL